MKKEEGLCKFISRLRSQRLFAYHVSIHTIPKATIIMLLSFLKRKT